MIFTRWLRAQLRRPRVLEITESWWILAESQEPDHWHLSYFLQGSYGNVLVNKPLEWRSFDEFFEAKGGLHWLVPMRVSEDHESDLQLFRRYGSRWVTDEEDPSFAHVPRGMPTMSGCIVRQVRKFQQSYELELDFRSLHFHYSTRGHQSAPALDRVEMLPLLPGGIAEIQKRFVAAKQKAWMKSPGPCI